MVQGWMCVKNGVVEGTPGNLGERIAGAYGPVGHVGILIGVVRPDSHDSEPLLGPFGPEICALAAELASQSGGAARAAYIAGDTTNEPPSRVGDVTLSRTGDEAETVTIEVLDHKGEVPVQQCEMPDGKTAPGLSYEHVVGYLARVLGATARTKLRLGGTRGSRPNLLVMPGIKEDMKFNKIHKKKATVHLERVMLCDMCGTVPRKSGKKTNACGVSVLMPGGEKVNLYVCLDCPSGPMVVRGRVVQVKKNLNRHSARAELA
jgi:hypothetical protein